MVIEVRLSETDRRGPYDDGDWRIPQTLREREFVDGTCYTPSKDVKMHVEEREAQVEDGLYVKMGRDGDDDDVLYVVRRLDGRWAQPVFDGSWHRLDNLHDAYFLNAGYRPMTDGE